MVKKHKHQDTITLKAFKRDYLRDLDSFMDFFKIPNHLQKNHCLVLAYSLPCLVGKDFSMYGLDIFYTAPSLETTHTDQTIISVSSRLTVPPIIDPSQNDIQSQPDSHTSYNTCPGYLEVPIAPDFKKIHPDTLDIIRQIRYQAYMSIFRRPLFAEIQICNFKF